MRRAWEKKIFYFFFLNLKMDKIIGAPLNEEKKIERLLSFTNHIKTLQRFFVKNLPVLQHVKVKMKMNTRKCYLKINLLLVRPMVGKKNAIVTCHEQVQNRGNRFCYRISHRYPNGRQIEFEF